MPRNLTCLRVFIASPGGLEKERKAFRDEIREFNESDAIERGFLFQPIGWENTLGGVGRPQTIINEDVRGADCLILVLWNRWGSPPDNCSSRFKSGTEEEFHVALECYDDNARPMHQIVIMFKAVDPQQLSDPGPQLQQVLDFKRELEQQKAHFFHTFDSTERFRRLIRRHLAACLRSQENDGVSKESSTAVIEQELVEGSATTQQQQHLESFEGSVIAKAWDLADEGRLTDAEVEFARSVVGTTHPQALVEYGRFLFRVGRLDQATVMFEGAVKVAQDQQSQAALAAAYEGLGHVRQIRGDLEGAEQVYRKALEINERLVNLGGTASNYGNLGHVRQIRGDLEGAEQVYRKALEINERLVNLGGMANNYGNLGAVFLVRRDLDSAEEMYRKSLEIDEKLGNLKGVASSYVGLGTVLHARGSLEDAEEVYKRSLEINERLGHLEGMANGYGSLGIVLQSRRDLDRAEKMYRKSLGIDERLGRLEGMANSYGNLGCVFLTRGDLDDAEQMLMKALEINEKLERLEGMVGNYGNLGIVLERRGDLDGAEQMYRKFLECAERLDSSQLIAQATSAINSLREQSSEMENDTNASRPHG